ncbi:MAG: c-type cytochrome biogenesis protein CcmI [Janthinobacterium lividum]
MVWFAFALMTVAAVLCVTWPLLRPRPDPVEGASDVAFYRQQLAELDSDVDRGVLYPVDIEATRIELGRRLIGAAERSGSRPAVGRRRMGTAAVATGVVLATAAGLYATVGHPNQPDAPLAARQTGKSDFASALAKIEAHLASDPDDARGLAIMAPMYMKLGRFDDAVRSYRGLIRVQGSSAERQSALGQAMVMAADGVVTGEARQTFDAALGEDPALPQARFFEGLAALQDGDKAKARTTWTALVDEAPPEAPYTAIIRQRLAELDGSAAPRVADAAASSPSPPMMRAPFAGAAGPQAGPFSGVPAGGGAIAALPADQQRVAIRGMVDGLAARLAENGKDADGWLKLVRAYRVLGEQDKAMKALADARASMTDRPEVLGRLDSLARELGLES